MAPHDRVSPCNCQELPLILVYLLDKQHQLKQFAQGFYHYINRQLSVTRNAEKLAVSRRWTNKTDKEPVFSKADSPRAQLSQMKLQPTPGQALANPKPHKWLPQPSQKDLLG